MSVKIMALEAENVKRIKAVALTPSPTGLTIVGGNNNQGKTSVLDALAWALGGDRFRPDAAQRDGAVAPAHLKVRLSNGVVVERKGKNSTLTVTDPTGRRSGQQLLNAFIEPLALDLPLFAPTHYAWGVTSIMLPAGVDGDKLLKVAADECGIVFAGGQDHYKGRMVRFGHMGWVDWADALAGLHALAHGLRASGGFSASRDYLETALSAYHRALDVEPGRVIPDVRS